MPFKLWPPKYKWTQMLGAYVFAQNVFTTPLALVEEFRRWEIDISLYEAGVADRRVSCFGCGSLAKVLKDCSCCGQAFCKKCNFWCHEDIGGCGIVLCKVCNQFVHRNSRGKWLCVECDGMLTKKRRCRWRQLTKNLYSGCWLWQDWYDHGFRDIHSAKLFAHLEKYCDRWAFVCISENLFVDQNETLILQYRVFQDCACYEKWKTDTKLVVC